MPERAVEVVERGGQVALAEVGCADPLVEQRLRLRVRPLAMEDVKARLKQIGFVYDGTSRQAMAAQRAKDYDVASRAVKIAGLKPE